MNQEKNPSIFSDSENLQPPSSTPEIVYFPDFQLIKILRKVFKDEIKPKDSSSLERPLFFSTVQNFCAQCDSLELHILKIFRKFALENLLKVKDRSNIRTFDDLQKLVAEGLGSEQGGAFAKKVSSDYDAALVDEFQDTDPLQFDILRKLFSLDKKEHTKRIFYIGDPKQSIYKFRGADLNNYLNIKTGLEPSKVFSLTTNYRTHPDLVSATNKFLTLHNLSEDGQTDESHLFLDKRISFIESKGSTENAPQKIFVRNNDDLSFSPFNIRYLPKLNKQEKQESFEQRILQDISSEIIKLLDFDKRTLIGENLLRGSDIAVLCRSNKEADKIQQKFLEFQIPSVLLADRSVFKTEEAQHFKYLMETLINPFESKMIKRVLLLPLFGLTAQKISDLSSNPTRWDYWANRFFEWSELWKKRGISYAIRNILNEEVHETQEGSIKVQEKILEEIGGERRLTNYLHLAESLYQAEQEISSFPRTLYLWYVQQTESNLKKEEADSRLESDEDSVKIITIHKAKGLEFPITFIPFCWKVHQKDKSKENQQENIRLLYVALTRASSRIYFYLREPYTQFKNSALCRCLTAAPLDKIEHIKSNSSLFHFTEVLEPLPQGAYRKPIRNESLKPLFFTSEIASGNISGSFSSKVKGIEKEKDFDESPSPTLVVPNLERIGAHAFPAGTKAGNFFHEVFENIDFQSHDFESLILRLLPLHGLSESNAELAKNIIHSTLQVSLDKHKGDSFKLSELSSHDRLEEMEFHLHARDFDFQELGNLLHQTEPGNRFAQYLLEKQSIGETSKELQYIKGFVDLTFKHSNKFYILDWKSNLLEGNQASFESSRLLDEMKHSDYLLQYHIYTLALHRYLKHCYAKEYDYDSLFGGAYYLFVRGTYQNINPDDGIFFDRPSKSIIETMDYFLSPKV
jgi:exodeoxyribonuclease V beta subunit